MGLKFWTRDRFVQKDLKTLEGAIGSGGGGAATVLKDTTISDFTGVNCTPRYSPITKTLSANVSAYTCAAVYLPADKKSVTFKLGVGRIVILGGDTTKWIGISLASDIGKIFEFTLNNYVVKQNNNTLWTGLTPPTAEDIIKVTIIDDNTYKIYIMKKGAADFTELLTLTKDQVPTITAWTNASRLGFSRANAFEGTGGYIDLFRDIQTDATTTVGLTGINDRVDALGDIRYYSRWVGAKWVALGDSITQEPGWRDLVSDLLKIGTTINAGISGTSMTSTGAGDTSAMSARAASVDNTADLVTVFGGTNDWGGVPAKPLGTFGDTANTTVYGAVETIINTILTNNPKVRLAFITPLQRNYTGGVASVLPGWSGNTQNASGYTLSDVADAIIKVCGKYGIPVLDLHRTAGITDLNKTQMLRDGLHPSVLGYYLIGRQIASFLSRI